MPALTNAYLTIAPDDYARAARVQVTCDITFAEEEITRMRDVPGPNHFTLFCWLVGRDDAPSRLGFLDRQQWLYWFQSQPLPQGDPATVERVTFEATLGHALLNEDVVGADEIMGRLLLRGWKSFRGVEVTAETNTVQHEFR